MNKRGLEHVEFILSFILFVGFLVFALYFFSPLKGDRIVDSTLFYTIDEITDNSTVVLESLSVVIDEIVTSEYVGVPVNDRSDKNVVVEDSNGEVLESYFNSLREIVFVRRGSERFILIKFSEDFEPSPVISGEELGEPNYSVSSFDTRKVLSEKRVREIKRIYESEEGYLNLRDDFNIPNRANFDFSLSLPNGEVIEATRNIPEGLETFSKTERHEILRNTGKTEFGDLRVRVW